MNSLLRGAGLALALSLIAAPAHADAILFLDDLSTVGIDVIVVDNVDGGVGTLTDIGVSTTADGSAGAGLITFNGVVGGFIVNVSTGLSNPVLGPYNMDLNSVNVSGAAGTIRVGLSDTDFLTFSTPQGVLTEIGGTFSNSATFTTRLDDANGDFGGVIVGSGVLGPGADSMTVSGSAVTTGLFSMSTTVELVHSGVGVSSFDAELTATPEPGSLALMGLALVGGLIWRRRRNA